MNEEGTAVSSSSAVETGMSVRPAKMDASGVLVRVGVGLGLVGAGVSVGDKGVAVGAGGEEARIFERRVSVLNARLRISLLQMSPCWR